MPALFFLTDIANKNQLLSLVRLTAGVKLVLSTFVTFAIADTFTALLSETVPEAIPV